MTHLIIHLSLLFFTQSHLASFDLLILLIRPNLKFLIELLQKPIKIISTSKMTESNAIQLSQQFLPLQSIINPDQQSKLSKKSKHKDQKKGKSILFKQLKRINHQDTQRKRECVIKYLNNQGQLKDVDKAISIIQRQKNSIPILQVAISLSRYNDNLLRQLLDSKNIQGKETEQAQIFQMNQKVKKDPILSLLFDSQTLKRISKRQNESNFIDYKHVSPKKINQIFDLEKGKFKKNKVQNFSHIQCPRQLKGLKNELYSLPYINKYKKIIDFKQKLISRKRTLSSDIKHISQLNSSIQSFGSSNKNIKQKIEQEKLLEKTLVKVLQNRNKSLHISTNEIFLPQIVHTQQIDQNLKTIQSGKIKDLTKAQFLKKSPFQTIRDSQHDGQYNPEQRDTLKCKRIHKSKEIHQNYWPEYKKFSPHNNNKITSQISRLQIKLKSFIQLPQIPTQETLSMYYSLKKLEDNDLSKLKSQSLIQQRQFSHTKYQIKYQNIKQNYSRRLKQFKKDKKMRQFQLQKCSFEQKQNLSIKKTKLNDKILQKMG